MPLTSTLLPLLLPLLLLLTPPTHTFAIPALNPRQVPEGPPIPGKVTFCNGIEATGNCTSQVVNFNECNPVPDGYVRNAGTMIVAAGARCLLSGNPETFNCTTHSDLEVSPPGNVNLFDVQGTDYGHQMATFWCESCDECRTN